MQRLHQEVGRLTQPTDPVLIRRGFGGLLGVSVQMQRVYRLIQNVGAHRFPVLILGETGTGKELAARSIHLVGQWRDEPFVPVDCSTLVPTLIESELFGHTKGAFAGALQARQGLLASAGGGTLFLDEIGELGLGLQAKLLRVIQEHEFRPIGATAPVPFRGRVIGATHHDLLAEVATETFREDLYFRLNMAEIKMPPLRERKGDIPLLIESFIDKFEEEGTKTEFSDAAMEHLQAYGWPGNVRELENTVERVLTLYPGLVIEVEDLNLDLRDGSINEPTDTHAPSTLAELERHAINRALQQASGDRRAAARILGIGATTLYRRLKFQRSWP